MSKSTRRWRSRGNCPRVLLCAATLAICAVASATEPFRLPTVEGSVEGGTAALYPQTQAAGDYTLWSSPPGIQLANHQEELPPGGAMPEFGAAYEEVIIPLDFGTCENCGNCDFKCPDYFDHWHGGRFFWGFYHAVCCPDPCYDPCWWALADAAFFVEAARPVTQTRLRWDAAIDMRFPDRAEYFWARSGGGGRGPANVETYLRNHDLTHYTEIAHGGFSAFFETPYRSYDAAANTDEAGFGDLVAGTKSMLLDCELLQITFQTKFITPTGVSTKGLGTGHLSIEPSLIIGLNMSSKSYIQAQVAEWIPIGGDPLYAGALLHYHFSYNRTLAGCPGHIHLISTAELNGWSFQTGAYSDPVTGTQSANDETYLSGGFGLRMVICDKVDFGVASALPLTDGRWAEQFYRSELRIRF
mgnify:CR=1 FL=1